MSRFQTIQSELVEKSRQETARAIDMMRKDGDIIGEERLVNTVERLRPGLLQFYGQDPADGVLPLPFNELNAALWGAVTNEESRPYGLKAMESVKAECTALLKRRFPKLAELGLGPDDLLETARQGLLEARKLRTEAHHNATHDGSDALLRRIRHRIAPDRAAETKRLAAAVDPRLEAESGDCMRALAMAVLATARLRTLQENRNAPVAPLTESGARPAHVNPREALAAAGALARHLPDAEREWVTAMCHSQRLPVAEPGHDGPGLSEILRSGFGFGR